MVELMLRKTSALVGASWLALAGIASAQTTDAAREARIEALEQALADIQAQLNDLKESSSADVAEVRRVASEQPVVAIANGRPTIASANNEFRFAIRGMAQFDAAYYDQDSPSTPDNRRGDASNAGDLNSGANFRRARLGIEGTVFGDWNYALTYEMGGTGSEAAQLNQAYIEYAGWRPWETAAPIRFRVGAWATPTGLEDATSNTESVFLERAAAAELVRGIAGGDGRSGFGVFANGDRWYASGVLTGATVGNSGEFDEQTGYLARLAWLPLRGKRLTPRLPYAPHLPNRAPPFPNARWMFDPPGARAPIWHFQRRRPRPRNPYDTCAQPARLQPTLHAKFPILPDSALLC